MSLRRTRAPMQRAADQAALEKAGLVDIDGTEWSEQFLISIAAAKQNTRLPF